MPLRARKGGEDVLAFLMCEDDWKRLRGSYRTSGLQLPCCSSQAIPKTSKLGNYFFAHARRGDCTSGPETKEHIRAKTIIAQTAAEAGWKVITEKQGTTPDGKKWIADVMCEQGQRKIAFEVQWSPQTEEVTRERQQIYASSGVEGVWFMRAKGDKRSGYRMELINDKSVPAFATRFPEDNGDISIDGFDVPLGEFVKGYLDGRVAWDPESGQIVDAEIVVLPWTCWQCRCSIGVAAGLLILDDAGNAIDFMEFPNKDAGLLIAKNLSTDLLQKYLIGSLKERYSMTVQGAYLSNGCYHCDAILGRFYYHELFSERNVLDPKFRVTSFKITLGVDINQFYSTWRFGDKRLKDYRWAMCKRQDAQLFAKMNST